MYDDKIINCKDCNDAFEFSAGEQEFYATKELNAPQRCKSCRGIHRANYEAKKSAPRSESGAPREVHKATCTQCKSETTVPFKPNPAKPVLCGDCFRIKKDGNKGS